MQPKVVKWNGFSLQTGPYRVTDSGDLFSSPTKKITSQDLARSDNSVVTFRRYQSGTPILPGTIRAASSDELEAAIDALKLNLLNQPGVLSVGWAGGTRYWSGECQNVAITRKASDVTQAAWSAAIFMPIRFANDGTTSTLASSLGNTLGAKSLPTLNNGTYLGLPYITLTLTDINPNISPVTITIGNPATSDYLEITDTFADGDIITIDTVNRQVFHGSTQLNPVGNYPDWLPGNGLMDYTDTASSRTIDIAATYSPRFL